MRKITPGGSPSKTGFQHGLKAVNPPSLPGTNAPPPQSDNHHSAMRRRLVSSSSSAGAGAAPASAKSPDQDSLGRDSAMSVITTSDSVSSSSCFASSAGGGGVISGVGEQLLVLHHHNGGGGNSNNNRTFGSSSSASSSSSFSGATNRTRRQNGSVGGGGGGSNHDSICSTGNVEDLIKCGMPDADVLNVWLSDLGYDEYFCLFSSAGYDMPTISRMTPEDLTAIGIQNPNHRKRLKSEIQKLNISDGLPNYIPATLEEWLYLLRLTEYRSSLHLQGYRTLRDAAQITVEDLEDVGIFKLGHQKRFLLGLKRVKELRTAVAAGTAAAAPSQARGVTTVQSHWQQQQHQPQPSGQVNFYQPDVVRIQPARSTPTHAPPPAPPPRSTPTISQHAPSQPGAVSLDPLLPLPPPPPHLPPVSAHYQPAHNFRGSLDDSFVISGSSFASGHPLANASSSSTFFVNSNSAHQWGTLPRSFRHQQPHSQLSLSPPPPPPPPPQEMSTSLIGKPVAKVPAYPRPPQPPQPPPEQQQQQQQHQSTFFEEKSQDMAAWVAEKSAASESTSDGSSMTGARPPQKNPMCLQRPGDALSADDVLDDIGSMLADLTDELDAMLHSEKA